MPSPRRLVLVSVLLTLAVVIGYPASRIYRQQSAVATLRRPGVRIETDPPWLAGWVGQEWYSRNLGTVRRVRIAGRITARDVTAVKDLDNLQWLEFDEASEKVWLSLPRHFPKLAIGLPDAGLGLAARRQISTMPRLDEVMIRRMGDGMLAIDQTALEPLTKLPRLRALHLMDMIVTEDFLFDLVRQFQHLERLELRNVDLRDDHLELLSHLAHLQELRMRDNHRLTDVCLESLAKMPSLRVLAADQHEKLTEAGLDGLRARRPDLLILTNHN